MCTSASVSVVSLSQIAARVGVQSNAVRNVIIWGNHSSTQFPDVSHATVDVDGKTLPVYEAVKDEDWIEGEFISVRAAQQYIGDLIMHVEIEGKGLGV